MRRENPLEPPVTPEADLTWLVHRAAQRMRRDMEATVAAHGVDLRGYLVLKALGQQGTRTQLELGHALGLDKSTLTGLLDQLEHDKLLVRRADPADRRARIPEATRQGRALHARIERAAAAHEQRLLGSLPAAEQRRFRATLQLLIGDDVLPGSCL